MKIAIMQFPHVIAKEVRLKQSVLRLDRLLRHLPPMPPPFLAMTFNSVANAIPRNDVQIGCQPFTNQQRI